MKGMTPDQDLMGDGIDPNKSIGGMNLGGVLRMNIGLFS